MFLIWVNCFLYVCEGSTGSSNHVKSINPWSMSEENSDRFLNFSLCIYYNYRLDGQTLYIIYMYRYIFTLNMLSLAVETDWDCQYFYTISSYVLLTSGSGWLAAQGTLVAIAVYRLQGDEGICRVGDGLFCSRFQNRYDAFHWPIWVWTLLKVI